MTWKMHGCRYTVLDMTEVEMQSSMSSVIREALDNVVLLKRQLTGGCCSEVLDFSLA